MIIELHCPQTEHVLFTAWEIPEYAWENRKNFILNLFVKYFNKQHIRFSQDEWQGNIIFYISVNQDDFYKIEKVFNKYFSTINVLNIVV